MRRFVNETVPLPTAVPMFRFVVPCNGPVPLVRLIATFRFAGRPTVESLPNASRVLTTGCAPKTNPAVAVPGWVANTSRSAVAGLTAMVVEVVLVKLPPVN